MFHFPRCRPPRLWIQRGVAGIALRGCPIRRPTGHGPPAPRRGISPLAASFFAIRCQGIRHAPEKLVRRNPCSAAAPPDFPDAPAGSRAPSGRGLPLLHSMLPSKSFYLSLPVVKEHPRRVARRGENYGMVGAPGLEPGTSSLSEKRSNQLSYAPAGTWWSRRDSNPRHPACKAGALPAELRPPRRAPAPRESSGAIRDGHRPRPEHSGLPL